jgi:hypothetical protein
MFANVSTNVCQCLSVNIQHWQEHWNADSYFYPIPAVLKLGVATLLMVARYFLRVAKICVYLITIGKFFVMCCIVWSQNFENF